MKNILKEKELSGKFVPHKMHFTKATIIITDSPKCWSKNLK